MCGIAGYIGYQSIEQQQIDNTLRLMKNRGPDQQDYAALSHGATKIYLLHSRLSIIDLDPRSNQPFKREHVTLVFNGEIYNYLELRSDLEKSGVKFTTASDTEVLIESYLKYGPDCVKKFEGMWSFALFDSKTGLLLLSRDRFAEKPLYLYEAEKGIYFASEIKFLQSLSGRKFTANNEQIKRYLVNGYKALYKHNQHFYNEVTEIPFATNVVVNSDLQQKSEQYWAPRFETVDISMADAIEKTRELLFKSVKLRLRSDVPLAFCLSGGVDSSALVAIAAKKFNCNVATYSIVDPDPRYNEFENIEASLQDLGCKNTIVNLQKTKSLDRLRELVRYHDGPLATISYYVHSMLSEAIAADGNKVVFSGTAADEFFTGYYDHHNLLLHELRNHPQYWQYRKDWEEHVQPFVRNPYLQDPELYDKDPNFRGHIYLNNDEFAQYLTTPFSEEFREEYFCDSLLRNRMANELYYEATRIILHEDDLNSMRCSLENRSPYLDSELVDFAYSIPIEHLMQNGYGKFVLREAVGGFLNDKVRLDRTKKGFNASIESVIDLNSPEVNEMLLSDSPVFEIVHRDKMEALLKQRSFPNSFSKFLFYFVNVKIFLEESV